MELQTQYVVIDPLKCDGNEISTLSCRLSEIGLDQEAFAIRSDEDGRVRLTFWEPDRIEALRILARIDGTS